MINPFVQEQIDFIAERCKGIKPLVVIRCITYNHEPYLKDALEGFVMQKTNFPFVAIVHDDASTDKTAEVLRKYAEKYPDKIFPIYEKENQYSKKNGSLREIMREACDVTGAKYVALCEGDDYWIDPLKLQKQVAFLEKNPDYGLICSDYKAKIESNNLICSNGIRSWLNNRIFEKNDLDEIKNGYAFNSLFKGCWIKTLTVCFRRNLMSNMPQLPNDAFAGDKALFFHYALNSKIKFYEEELGVYRVLDSSACHINDYKSSYIFGKSIKKLDEFYFKEGNISKELEDKILNKWYRWEIRQSIKMLDFPLYVSLIKKCNKPTLLTKIKFYNLNFLYRIFIHIKKFDRYKNYKTQLFRIS